MTVDVRGLRSVEWIKECKAETAMTSCILEFVMVPLQQQVIYYKVKAVSKDNMINMLL